MINNYIINIMSSWVVAHLPISVHLPVFCPVYTHTHTHTHIYTLMESCFSPPNTCGNLHVGEKLALSLERISDNDETSKRWEKAMAPYSSTLAWKIPWTEEPGRLQSMGFRRVGQD